MDTRIRPLREARGWSQLDLATAAGTSQQQVARIESGSQSVRLELALALAAALEADLAEVFPQAKRPLARARKRAAERRAARPDSGGGDDDPATWLLSFRLRGGAAIDFVVPSESARALRERLGERAPASPFFLFDSGRVSAAVLVDHLLHYHELWDGTGPDDWHDDRVPLDQVAVWLADAAAPLLFEVGPWREADAGDHPRDLLALLDTAVHPTDFISFRDADGEQAFFRAGDVALVTVPVR